MQNNKTIAYLSIVLSILFIISLSIFTVNQGQVALVTRVGNIVMQKHAARIYLPGIHLKLPFLDTVIKLDARLQSFDVPSSRVLTKEQKSVDVDYFVKWRIKDFSLYYTRTTADPALARNLLVRKVNDLLRASFGDKQLVEVISDNRQDLMQHITDSTNQSTQDIGIEVIDVRVKSIDYPKEVTASVYQRMKTQREQVAKMYRANGHMRAKEISSEADRESNVLQADAALTAATIRSQGDQEAASIAIHAYSSHPKFYKFWRMLRTYETSMQKDTVWILDGQSGYMRSMLYDTQATDHN